MKKIAFILILILFIPTAAIADNDAKNDELVTLASLAIDNNLVIEQWQVTIKERITQVELQTLLENMKDSYLVTITEDENAIKYTMKDTHKTEGITEVYSAIVPKDAALDTEFIAVIKGDTWNESILHSYQQKLDYMMKHYFTKLSKRFACLTTEDDGIIKGDRFLNETMQYLDLKYVSTQIDKMNTSTNKKIIYGYTSLWEQKVTIMDKPMNVQIAIKNMENGNSKITVGTPILINEY